MLREGAVVIFDEATHMGGDALALVVELDDLVCSPAPELLPDHGVWDAVEVIIEAHVVVDVRLDLFVLGNAWLEAA